MKIKIWVELNSTGSCAEDTIELDDDLTEEEIHREVINHVLDSGMCEIDYEIQQPKGMKK